jgi:hypothetical protein
VARVAVVRRHAGGGERALRACCDTALAENAAYPLFSGTARGASLVAPNAEAKPWSAVHVVRIPSRRTFLRLLADPSFAEAEPLKSMAVELDLVPLTGERVLPDLRLVAGAALLTAWRGAVRRAH